jgi:hypothetical protein
VAVPVDGKGTASVGTMKAPPVPGMQKPACRVGKRKEVNKPAGLKTKPAWLRQDRLNVNPAVCHGDVGCQALYIQGLYRAVRVHQTGLTVNQGCRQISTVSYKSQKNKTF